MRLALRAFLQVLPWYLLKVRDLLGTLHQISLKLLPSCFPWRQEHPVVLTKFIEGAREVEMDAVGKDGRVSTVSSFLLLLLPIALIFPGNFETKHG